MRKGWQEERLGQVCTVVAGQSPKGSAYNNVGEGLPFHQGKKYFGEVFLGDSNTWTTQVTKEAFPGDILMSVRAPVGPINFTNQHLCIGRGLAAIRATEKVEPKFIYFCLLFKRDEIQGNEGAVFSSINKRQIEEISIPLPTLSEQKRIVAILDEAFAGIDTAIANTEKNLANARELLESYLNSVFSQRGEGWVEKPLANCFGTVSTGPFGSLLHKSDYISDGVPLVNPINIVGEEIWPDERKMIGDDTKGRLRTYILKENDIVIARRGEIGRCAVVTKRQSGWVCGTGCFFIRPTSEVNPNFLAHLLRSAIYRTELERRASGATMLNLSNKALSTMEISMPFLEEQNRILDQISELKSQCQDVQSNYQKKLTALAELKQSLLQKAFSGELTGNKAATNLAIKEEDVA